MKNTKAVIDATYSKVTEEPLLQIVPHPPKTSKDSYTVYTGTFNLGYLIRTQ